MPKRKNNSSQAKRDVQQSASGSNNSNSEVVKVLPKELRNVVELLPADKQDAAARQLISVISHYQSYHGPTPPASELQGYENIIPGSANRIIKLAEEEASHRRGLEKNIVRRQFNQSSAGQWLGFVLSSILIAVGGLLTYLGHDTVGGIIFGTTIIGLATVFALGRWNKKEEEINSKQN